MVSKVLILGLLCVAGAFAEIPSYIHVCKRNDPKLEQCIVKSVEALRPKLVEGIPELDVPAMEPLALDNLVIQHGGRMLKFRSSDFVVHGTSNYKIEDMKVDLPNLNFQIKMTFPKITVDSMHEVSGKFLSLNLNGKGPVSVIADDVDGNAIMKGELVERDGKTYFNVADLDLKMNLKNYEVKLSKGFFKDPAITDAVNAAIHENKREIINMVRPRVESVVKDVVRDISNNITRHFTYDELFPAN